MVHATSRYEHLAVYLLAAAIIITMSFVPVPAQSGVYTSGGPVTKQPRWSNDHQLRNGVHPHPDCNAPPFGFGADYIPGIDAWGKPVMPAEPQQAFKPAFPMGVDLDVNLGTKHVGGKDIDLYGRQLTFDPNTNEVALNGHVWSRDCLPPHK